MLKKKKNEFQHLANIQLSNLAIHIIIVVTNIYKALTENRPIFYILYSYHVTYPL